MVAVGPECGRGLGRKLLQLRHASLHARGEHGVANGLGVVGLEVAGDFGLPRRGVAWSGWFPARLRGAIGMKQGRPVLVFRCSISRTTFTGTTFLVWLWRSGSSA